MPTNLRARRLPVLVILILEALLAQPRSTLAAARRLAVLEFSGKKLDDDVLRAFSDAVRGGAVEALTDRGVIVMTRENMLVLLKKMGKQSCSEGDCEVETARNIGADYVVSGSVTRVDQVFFITLKLHETQKGSLLGTDQANAKTQFDLLTQLREQGRELVRVHVPGSRSGAPAGQEKRIEAGGDFSVAGSERIVVKFESDPTGAAVLVDGDMVCKETPCSKAISSGSHEAEMLKERYTRARQSFRAKRGTVVRLALPENFATLVVRTVPAGLPIAINGRTAGGLSLESVIGVESSVIGSESSVSETTMDEQIKYLLAFLDTADPDDPVKPDWYLRLGECYARKHGYLMNQARALDQKIFEAQQANNPGQAASLKQLQQKHEREAEGLGLKAVKSYVVATKYPKYDSRDEALFRLASLLQTMKKEGQAREFFHRLIRDHPQSKHVPEAFLAFAELYYRDGEMENAGKFYERVTQFTSSSVFGFALYKKGWVEINLGNFRSALEIFVKLIELCRNGKVPGNQVAPLEREAKKGLVKAYAKTPGAVPEKAWDFFQRHGGDSAPKMLDSLLDLYREQGMLTEASKVCRKLVLLQPDVQRRCD